MRTGGRLIGAMAVVAASLFATGAGAVAAHAATTYTWGGTPLAPTGTTTQHPGITNDPSLVAPEQFPYPQPQRGHPRVAAVRDALAECGLLPWTREIYARHRGSSAAIRG